MAPLIPNMVPVTGIEVPVYPNPPRSKGDCFRVVLNKKYANSSFCQDELCLAKSKGKQIMPILMPGFSFSDLPNGLQYTLASTNCVRFTGEASHDTTVMEQLVVAAKHIQTNEGTQPSSHTVSLVAAKHI